MKATSNAAAVRAATRSRSSAPDLGARPPLLHQPAVQTLRSSSIPTNVAAPSSSGRLVGGHCVPRGAMLQPRARMDAEGNGGALPPRRVERTLKTQPSRNVAGKLDIGSQNKRELLVLVDMLPESIREVLVEHEEFSHLVEVILDIGRLPVARFPSGDVKLAAAEVTYDDLDHAVSKVGEFGGDNRAGINRCLHRISCLRNRAGRIVGLTCRVGRVVPGTAELVGDLLLEGMSVLLLGCPGVGKTTALRDICRLLSEDAAKRVIAVDTSNEIGGDGDIPHPAIGRARRLQVPVPERQHSVMIEAVENHMPEVIVIDEIGTEAEALAARTIAERGVQLVATCHGNTLENVLRNPSLNELVGGVGSVTLGDEGARARGSQKTVLERQGPPAFSCVVEMISRTEWIVHLDTGRAVDVLLSGRGNPGGQIRKLRADGKVTTAQHWEAQEAARLAELEATAAAYAPSGNSSQLPTSADAAGEDGGLLEAMNAASSGDFGRTVDEDAMRLYCLGIEEEDLLEAAKSMGVAAKVSMSDSLDESDAVLTTRHAIKEHSWARSASTSIGVPIFALRSSKSVALIRGLRQILGIDPSPAGGSLGDPTATVAADPSLVASQRDLKVAASTQQAWSNPVGPGHERAGSAEELQEAEEEARIAIENIVIPRQQPIELRPRPPAVVELQVSIVKEYGLGFELAGVEGGAGARVRVLPEVAVGTP